MLRSNSDSTSANSPTPISPFSNSSLPSEATSDETPDLGAFTIVLREWAHMHPPPRTRALTTPSTTTPTSTSYEHESSALTNPRSTVWSHQPIASYLSLHDPGSVSEQNTRVFGSRRYLSGAFSSEGALEEEESRSSDTEADRQTVEINSDDPAFVDPPFHDSDGFDEVRSLDVGDEQQPSLGFLEEALRFLAGERERVKVSRESTLASSTTTITLEPTDATRKKRRRRRVKQALRSKSTPRFGTSPSSSSALVVPGTYDDHLDADESSSSYDVQDSGVGTSNETSSSGIVLRPSHEPPRPRGRQRRSDHSHSPTTSLLRSRSVPQLRVHDDVAESEEEPSARASRLKELGAKLAKLFPQDRASLKTVNYGVIPTTPQDEVVGDVIDTRGRAPGPKDERIVHVFVDHSNILIGLLNYLKRYPQLHPQYRHSTSDTSTPNRPAHSFHPKPPKHLSHSALTLILERGRPVSRRVLCTSSPLYQPMDTAKLLGYEVRIFARVPDTGDGMDRERKNSANRNNNSSSSDRPGLSKSINTTGNIHSFKKAHWRSASGSASNESDPPTRGSLPHSRSATTNSLHTLSDQQSGQQTPTGAPPRIRYREQGVDELLQLKLHQALASIDGPPPKGSTIVLATGDGNVGQFNEDGFLGSVRTALKRGWKVELYAWEGGLSRSWKREFGEESEWGMPGPKGSEPMFKVIGIEQFGAELVEMYY